MDFELLVLFAGLFVVTEGARRLGLGEAFLWTGTPLGLLLGSALLSLLVSNVPAALLLAGHEALLLAGSTTLAGNLLLASVAEGARRVGVTLLEHLRFGLPLTLVTLAALYLRLA